jgi:hypothetical protein
MNKTALVHLLAKCGVFVIALVLDVTGNMSTSMFNVTLALIGALGLNGAVHAFRQTSSGVIEKQLADILGEVLGKELEKHLNEKEPAPEPPPAPPTP